MAAKSFQQYVSDITNCYCGEIIISISDGSLIKSIADVQEFSERKLLSYKFQLGIVLRTLMDIKQANVTIRSLSLVDSTTQVLREIIWERYQETGFRYFEFQEFPQDLDTMASIISVLHQESIVVQCATTLVDESWKDRYTSVFLAKTESETRTYQSRFHCGNNPWHLDVLVNAAVSEQLIGARLLGFETAQLLAMEPINYWYIPSSYTYYQMSRLCYLKGIQLPHYSLAQLNRQDSVPQMQEIFLNRRCSTLEKFLYTVATNSVVPESLCYCWEELSNDDPVLYPSVGFNPYRSMLMYKTYFIQALIFDWIRKNSYQYF